MDINMKDKNKAILDSLLDGWTQILDELVTMKSFKADSANLKEKIFLALEPKTSSSTINDGNEKIHNRS